MDFKKLEASVLVNELENTVKSLEALRKGKAAQDISLSEFMKEKHQMSLSDVMADLGIDSSYDTINNIFTVPNPALRWIVPEIIREAISVGYRKKAIWPNLIAAEETIANPSATIPWINVSEVTPKKVGEAETISLGSISYGDKSFKIGKIGRGMQISYEVRNFTSLNVFSLFVQDFGLRMGLALDALLIDTLINGEQADGSESAPVIGVATPGTVVYRDLLKLWIRMSRIGRIPTTIIGGEDAALDTLDLNEFKNKDQVGTSRGNLVMKTPIPNSANYFVHGSVPANQQIFIDPSSAIIKYNATPLLVESEKIVSNQTEAVYATMTTGFATAFRDGRVILDKSLNISTNGFPTYMDVDPLEQVTIQ